MATSASTTAVGLAERFGPAQLAGVEEGIGEIVGRVMGLLPATRRAVLRTGGATIDLDGTDVECYGSEKEGIAYSYNGARTVSVAAEHLLGVPDGKRPPGPGGG